MVLVKKWTILPPKNQYLDLMVLAPSIGVLAHSGRFEPLLQAHKYDAPKIPDLAKIQVLP
jgi:hypothetical protein